MQASADLLELTRRMYAGGGDPYSPARVVDAFTGSHAPDVVWESVGLGTTFTGRDATRQFVGDWLARFADYSVDVEEIADLGHGVIYAKSSHTGRPIGSAPHARLPAEILVHVYVWEGGMITRVISSGDTPEARASAERLACDRGLAG